MNDIAKHLNTYIESHPFDSGNSNCETVLDMLYQAYIESHDTDPPEISNGFKELEQFLRTLPLSDNDAVFNLCCRLCIAYEHKAFLDGLQYGAHLISELHRE
jgi:hypothetical protein